MKAITEIMTNTATGKEIMKTDTATGLTIGISYSAGSGFEYISGLRKFGKLTIVESVGSGVVCTFLNSVRVLDENNVVIIDKAVHKGMSYSRESVRLIVRGELLNMLSEAAERKGIEFNQENAKIIIDDQLKDSYYSQSYSAALNWAESLGIEFQEQQKNYGL